MSRDGKDSFYRQLEVDDETKKIIKWFRKVKKELMDDKVKDINNEI